MRNPGGPPADITALERTWVLFRTFVEHTPAAIAMLDRDLRYLAASRRWVQDFELGDRDLTGLHHYDVFSQLRSMEEWQRIYARCLAGSTQSGEDEQFVRPDGRVDWLRWEIRPWRDELDAIGGIIIFSEVITERKAAEARLHDREQLFRGLVERYRLIVENQTEFIVKWLPDGTRTFVNETYCRTFGVSEAECLGTSFLPLVDPAFRVAILKGVEGLSPTAPEFTEEHRSFVAGGVRWQQWTSRGIFDSAGRLIEILSTGRDITERVRLDEQLRQSQKMQAIGQLAGGVAHDFNNLLTIINGHTEALLDTHTDAADPARAELIAVRDAAERAAQLTRQLLVFGRKAVREPRAIDLNHLVQNTGRMLRRLIGEHITMTMKAGVALPGIMVDPGQMEQVILNLSLNARDAMPSGGTLTIETQNVTYDAAFCLEHPEYSAGHFVVLRVADTGTGIPSEMMEHLFEPFFTTKGVGRGTGLGLATVYGVVHESGGFITVTSVVGKGSTFAVHLPALERVVETIAVPPETGAATPGSETILLVEDEDGVRRLAMRVLASRGYTMLVANDGRSALEQLAVHGAPVDLLVTDVVMPGMNGRELAAAVLERCPRCRVLFVSGYSEEQIGADDDAPLRAAFLQKPFSPSTLARRAREILDAP